MTSPSARIFISYSRHDGKDYACELRRRLSEEHGFSLWQDLVDLEGGKDWWQQISEAIKNVEFLVMIMTPCALQSEVMGKEWRLARQEGVCVLPVIAAPGIDFDTLPRWVRNKQFIDPKIPEQWTRFIRTLENRCTAARVPFMVEDMLDSFVERHREFDPLISYLTEEQRTGPAAISAALRGAGGYGKTTLARAVCHDQRITDVFDDGILWVTIGEDPGDLTGLVEDLIYSLEGRRPGCASVDAATAHLVELLADSRLLIVIDDVWNQAHLKPFIQGGPRCARLITTRDNAALPRGTRVVAVDAMRQEEAIALLGGGLPSGEEEALRKLSVRLGEWPLLLKLVNGALLTRVEELGQAMASALTFVNKALDKRGLIAFDAENARERSQAVAMTLGVSFDLLSEKQLARYEEMAVFPEVTDIPMSTVEKLWEKTGGFDDFDTEELCERLARLSLLVRFDPTTRHIRLHDVVRTYLVQRLGDRLPSLHDQLIEAHRPPRNDLRMGSGDGSWADMPGNEPHMWDYLAYHLTSAGRGTELVDTVKDLRYLAVKTSVRPPLAVESDLLAAESLEPDDEGLHVLRRSFVQSGHILNRCERLSDLAATLHSRLQHLNELRPLINKLADGLPTPYLAPLRSLPDLPHPALVRTLTGHTGAVTGCAISDDGQKIVSASTDKTIRLWNARTGAAILALEGHSAKVSNCAISAGGEIVVSASDDYTLKVWNAKNGGELATLRGHTAEVNDCAISSDGARIVSASYDGTLKVWSVSGGAEVMTLRGHQAGVSSCGISADGSRIISASDDGTLKVWDGNTGEEIGSLEGHRAGVRGCAFSRDGERIVSASDDETLKIWETQSGAELMTLDGHKAGVNRCAVSNDGGTLVSASYDWTLKIWDGRTGEERLTLNGHTAEVNDCAISADGDRIVSASDDRAVKVWEWVNAAELMPVKADAGRVNDCAISADGKLVVSASDDRILKLWDASTGAEEMSLIGHAHRVSACAISTDRERIVSASYDRTLKVWSARDGTELMTLKGHSGWVMDCAVSPDNKRIVSASDDGTLKVWDATNGSELMVLEGHNAAVSSCEVTADGQRIISGSHDGTLKVWDARSGAELVSMVGHTAEVNDCSVSVDGGKIVSTSDDATVRIWDALSGSELTTLRGHKGWVRGCAISPDGARIISAADDQTLRLWDIQTRECLASLHVDGALNKCAWSADGSNIVVAGNRGVYFLQLVE